MAKLAEKISIGRRYFRSINLERDIDNPDAVTGFVMTSKANECLERLCSGFQAAHGTRAWTLTGPYGSGKSSFLQYLLALLGPKENDARVVAESILASGRYTKKLSTILSNIQSKKGFVRCISTCRVEPISHAVVRSLVHGCERFFGQSLKKQPFWKNLSTLNSNVTNGESIEDAKVLRVIEGISRAAQSPIMIVLDELGKSLEFASRKRSGDLFLLQQLAELPIDEGSPRVFIIGLLHQSFADYADMMAQASRNEWNKVQGRFEDISFIEATKEHVALLANAISITDKKLKKKTEAQGKEWNTTLNSLIPPSLMQADTIASVFPLHPIAACLIPTLCSKLGQNERSLFTLLTSDEAGALRPFLENTEAEDCCYKLSDLFEYLSQSGIKSAGSRGLGARWIEIEEKISGQSTLSDDELLVLKTIGLFNLVSTAGVIRASRKLVTLALLDSPTQGELNRWESILDDLVERNIIVYRKHIDEYRLWDGSDFDVEEVLKRYRSRASRNFAAELSLIQPLSPVIAQRHSYLKGSLRLFECMYCDDEIALKAKLSSPGADGLVVYWLSPEFPKNLPDQTPNGKPIVLLHSDDIESLLTATTELMALQGMYEESPELRVDRVARKEVSNRLFHTRLLWEATFFRCFGFVDTGTNCISRGEEEKIASAKRFNSLLSDICDITFSKSPRLWNELINRRELTSQGAKARRELLEAVISSEKVAQLGLSGYGPEVSMYKSVFEATGIHKKRGNEWSFGKPSDNSFIPLWMELEKQVASGERVNIFRLYQALEAAPYGLKTGVIPLLLAAFFAAKQEELSVYKDGTFIGALGVEHYELLVKDPTRFEVKGLTNLESQRNMFAVYQKLLVSTGTSDTNISQSGVLSLVKPLMRFIKKLPAYSQHGRKLLKADAVSVRDCILNAREPDSLFFEDIPKALGFANPLDKASSAQLKSFESKFAACIKNLSRAYPELLDYCSTIICEEFGLSAGSFKQIRMRLQKLAQPMEASDFSSLAFQLFKEKDLSDEELVRRISMVIADKPPESWQDADLDLFPGKAKAYIYKLRNFEAIHSEMTAPRNGNQELSRISLMSGNGEQVDRLILFDKSLASRAEKLAEQIVSQHLSDDSRLGEAVLAKLAERLFKSSIKKSAEG